MTVEPVTPGVALSGRLRTVGEAWDVEVPGGALAAERWAGDGSRVVLLHADVADRRSWHVAADLLGDTADVVAYDRRGFGGTPNAAAEFRHVDDLVAVIETIGGPAVLVGSAGGGRHAVDAALLAPRLVSGLVLLAPGVGKAPRPAVDPASLVLIERLNRAYADRDETEIARLHTWLWLDGPGVPEGRVGGLPRTLAREMIRREVWRGAGQAAGKSGIDAWSRLGQITVPTVVACGELDLPHLVDQSRRIADLIPGASSVSLPGTAHLPMLDAPDAVADLIRRAVAARSSPT